jgi:hypothetical protein
MTGVPRLQHLPVPAVAAGTTAVAVPAAGDGQRVRAVQPVTPAQPSQARAERGTAWVEGDSRDRIDDSARQGRERAAVTDSRSGREAAAGRLINFSRLTAMPFMVQVLGQQTAASRSQVALPQTCLTGHRDAALLGSDIYRRAGGEPEMLPDGATFVRLAV